MTSEEIDTQIVDAAGKHWRKVAFIVAKVGQTNGDVDYSVVADRIRELVREGRLLAQGDLADWRRSEVRLAGEISK